MPAFPAWFRRLGYYGLALLWVGVAALLHWALRDVLSPAPFLVFYLAWVGAAAFGGLGPGLLATLVSWGCIDFLFDSAPGQVGLGEPASLARVLILLAGGLAVSMVGETMRRSRIYRRRQGRELADANAALRTSEAKYRLLVENSKDITWTVDLQGQWTFISSNMEKVTGYRADELIGKRLWDFLAPECHDLVKERLRRRVRGEDLPPYEVMIVGRDGRHTPFEVLAASVIDNDGNIVGVQGVARDITERKRAEETLRASQSMLQLVMGNVPQGIFWKDRHSTYLGCNNVFAQAVGLESAGDIVGKTDYDLPWSPEQTASFRAYDLRIMDSDAPEYHIIEQMREADGRLAWVETNKVPLHDARGNVIGILGTYEDITERKQAEQALRQEKIFTDRLLNAPLDTVFAFEPVTGKPVRWNKRCAEVSGYDDEEIAGMKAPDDFYDEDDLKKANECTGRILADGQGVVALSLITKQGVHIPFEYVATVVEAEDGKTLLLSIGRDITERKRAEEALREWNATLESKVAQRTEELEDRARQLQKLTLELTEAEERERKRLAEILHDDLQQVLAAAKFQVGLLDGRVRNDTESQEIAGQAKDLLVDAIAKSRRLSHELRSPALSLSELSEAFEWLAEQMQTKHGLTVHLDVCERIELPSEPLRVLLYKAAQESLFNVIKHAGVHEAKLRLRHRHGRIWLSVSDEGRGFDPMEPGYNLGFGLLSIRERVGYLGGRMKIRSAVGKGSIFLITVPDSDARAGE
jgi:PAS domain S-box-containing protein